MLNKKSKGFTLIELLVVIAIIGILASIVLISLGNARDRAKDARIMAGLSQVRAIAEMEHASNSEGGYSDICDAGSDDLGSVDGLSTISTDIENNQESKDINCQVDADNYCIAVDLNGDGSFCISSDGVARVSTGSTTAQSCETSTTSCGL